MPTSAAAVPISAYELREYLRTDVHLRLWLQEQSPLAVVGYGQTVNDDPLARWLIECGADATTVIVSDEVIVVNGSETDTPRWARSFIRLVDERGALSIMACEADAILREARRNCRSVSRPCHIRPPVWQVAVKGGPHLTETPVRIPIRAAGSRRRQPDLMLNLFCYGFTAAVLAYLAWAYADAIQAGRL